MRMGRITREKFIQTSALKKKGLRRSPFPPSCSCPSIQTSALKKKGLRRVTASEVRSLDHSNVCPEEEGIKTGAERNGCFSEADSNVCPEEEGIKTYGEAGCSCK